MNGVNIKNIFNPTPDELYALAKEQGDKRFGSECKHEVVRGGKCVQCLRTVYVKETGELR